MSVRRRPRIGSESEASHRIAAGSGRPASDVPAAGPRKSSSGGGAASWWGTPPTRRRWGTVLRWIRITSTESIFHLCAEYEYYSVAEWTNPKCSIAASGSRALFSTLADPGRVSLASYGITRRQPTGGTCSYMIRHVLVPAVGASRRRGHNMI